jgi:acetyl esterase/lipase
MTSQAPPRYDPFAVHEISWRDIEYRRASALALSARVYTPKGDGPFPTLVEVHGGAWGAQDKLFNAVSQEALARTGLVVASLDFRTSAQAPHPAALEDINYAIRWFKAHAAEFNGTPVMFGAVGWSSGGHQVMLSAMRPQAHASVPLPEAPAVDARPAYVIMGWPVIDPAARYAMAGEKGDEAMRKRHLAYFGNETVQREANPLLMLERGERVELPPALILQGAADEALPRMMAERFVEVYSLAGGVIELAKYPGEPHGFAREVGRNTHRARDLMASFIARQLKAAQQGW